MALKSLIVCADTKALQVLRQIFEDLGVGVEHCEHSSLATSRVATGSFDAIVIDAADPHGLQLISTARHSSENHTSLIVVLVDAREQVRELFTQGVNFVLYKPITPERAASSLRAARGMMRRGKSGKLRIRLHAQATIAYANAGNVPAPLLAFSEGGLAIQSERRLSQPRHACRLGADVFRQGSTVPNRCVLSDISAGGCYVETTEPFPAGAAVEIIVRTLAMKLRVQGVVQVAHPGFGMGVKFTLKTAEQREQVEHLVACQVSEEDIRV